MLQSTSNFYSLPLVLAPIPFSWLINLILQLSPGPEKKGVSYFPESRVDVESCLKNRASLFCPSCNGTLNRKKCGWVMQSNSEWKCLWKHLQCVLPTFAMKNKLIHFFSACIKTLLGYNILLKHLCPCTCWNQSRPFHSNTCIFFLKPQGHKNFFLAAEICVLVQFAQQRPWLHLKFTQKRPYPYKNI